MAIGEREPVVLEVPKGSSWTDSSEIKHALEQIYLPKFLSRARWFPERLASKIRPRLVAFLPLERGRNATTLAVIETDQKARYILPLRADWMCDTEKGYAGTTVAPLRQGKREGWLRDVAADHTFITRLLANLRHNASIVASGRAWRLDFKPTSKFPKGPAQVPSHVRAIAGEQSNSTALVDQDYVVKLYRHIEPGQNPEIEMGHFLTEKTGFAHTPALLGHVEAVQASETCAVGIVHRFVPNQGDAWTYSADRINIYLDAIAAGSEGRDTALTVNRDYIFWIRRMGRRVAEMHRALSDSETPEFKPEPIEEGDLKIWTDDILTRADRVLGMLEKRVADLDKELLARVLRSWHRLPSLSRSFGGACMGRCKTRHHGDLHLGQILVADHDAIIIDFEGEPSRPLHERRRKAPAARDVAGVVRSLDYAAMAARQQRLVEEGFPQVGLRALLAWRDRSTEAFLHSYLEAAGQSLLWPDSADDAKAMLNFFLLEKALYEVEYELSYRPLWVSVPLEGIRDLLEGNV
jgi:trehalose synthase-fused probable maltokinase